MLFIEYPKCSTCQKAKKWLEEHNITYTDRHIVEDNPTYEELKEWQSRSGLPATDGMLVKRPFVVDGDLVLTGFREAEWKEKLI